MKVAARQTQHCLPDDVIGGHYRVICELGRGGMGQVYEAENLRTHRRVALKTVRADAHQHFEHEARAAGQLRHPNVVEVIDVGDDRARGLSFIVYELLDGADLAWCLRAVGPLSPRAALATLLPVADALAAAHARGVVHCDVKPDNIFLHEGATGVVPKLIDFGIATLADDAPGRVGDEVVGSPSYVSPERARGDRDVDGRADVWSLGMVFYKCLSAAVAYTAPTTSMLLAKIIRDEPTALAALAPHLPRDLVAVVQRAVEKDRARRWPSMAAFAAALRGCEVWRGVTAAQAQRWVVNGRGESLDAPAATTATASDAPEVATWAEVTVVIDPARRRSRGWIAALATALVATVALWPRATAPRPPMAAVTRAATPRVVAAVAEEPIAEAPMAVAAPVVATTEAPVVTAVRATAPRAVRRVNPPSGRGGRAPVARPTAGATRGFNGAVIIE